MTTKPHMSEAELLETVRQLARLAGFMTYHTHDSRRSEPGWPDLAMVHPRHGRLIFAELKSDTGRLTGDQQRWLAALFDTGAETYVWRPKDLPHIADTLRGTPRTPRTEEAPAA